MWEKFGEFLSAEELNRAALAERNEGDSGGRENFGRKETAWIRRTQRSFLHGDVDCRALPRRLMQRSEN